MRVTFNSIRENSLVNINREGSKQARLQTQIASGQRIATADGDPLVAQKILTLQSSNAQDQQYYRNVGYALDVSHASYNAMNKVRETVDRSGEIAESISGLTTPDAFRSYAEEVNGLIEQSISAVNQQFDGKSLFGGTKTDAPPFSVTRDAAGQVTGVTYAGSAEGAYVQVSDNSTIAPYANAADNNGTADFINRLVSMRTALSNQDASAIDALRPGLRTSENNVLDTMGKFASTQGRLESMQETLSERFDQSKAKIDSFNDVDLAKAMVELTRSQTAYQAAIQTTAQIGSKSLLDYL